MLRHYTKKISIHNAEVEKANRILLDFLEADSLGEVELNRSKEAYMPDKVSAERRELLLQMRRIEEVRQGTKTYAKHQDRAVRSHERSYNTKDSQDKS